MSSAALDLVGILVRKPEANYALRHLASPELILGRVIGTVPAAGQRCLQPLYRVIYEDGDEASLKEAEVFDGLVLGNNHGLPLQNADNKKAASSSIHVPRQCKSTSCFGRVTGLAPHVPGKELEYRVVFEDGDEACVLESELRLWLARCSKHSNILSAASLGTKQDYSRTEIGTSIEREVSSTTTTAGMRPGVSTQPSSTSTTTPLSSGSFGYDSWLHSLPSRVAVNRCTRVARNTSTIRFDSSCGRRRFSQGPMPTSQWQYHSCSGWYDGEDSAETSSFGGWLVNGLCVLVLAFLVAMGINRLAEWLIHAFGLDVVFRWIGLTSVDALDVLGFESAWPAAHVEAASFIHGLPKATL